MRILNVLLYQAHGLYLLHALVSAKYTFNLTKEILVWNQINQVNIMPSDVSVKKYDGKMNEKWYYLNATNTHKNSNLAILKLNRFPARSIMTNI